MRKNRADAEYNMVANITNAHTLSAHAPTHGNEVNMNFLCGQENIIQNVGFSYRMVIIACSVCHSEHAHNIKYIT